MTLVGTMGLSGCAFVDPPRDPSREDPYYAKPTVRVTPFIGGPKIALDAARKWCGVSSDTTAEAMNFEFEYNYFGQNNYSFDCPEQREVLT